MPKLKALREIVTTKEAKCLRGMGIPAGTTLHVMKESPPVTEDQRVRLGFRKIHVVRLDNGTGHLSLMHETAVYEADIL